jgi:hypothetical protein
MKKEYLKPTMSVVELQQQCQILSGSGGAKGLLENPEGIIWDNNGLGDNDILR